MCPMTWGSFDDGWTDRPMWYGVPYEARWHYMALVGRICATRQWSGILPKSVALRVSDVPDPEAALVALEQAGAIRVGNGVVELLLVDEHVPPPSQRPDVNAPRKRASQVEYRRRKCERGEHSKDCPANLCPEKVARRKRVASALPGNAGRGGTGREDALEEDETKPRVPAQRVIGWDACPQCGCLEACPC